MRNPQRLRKRDDRTFTELKRLVIVPGPQMGPGAILVATNTELGRNWFPL